MIYQLAEISINTIVGVSLMFGLALLMTVLTSRTIQSFFIFLTMFSGFIVWSGLIDLWILIINLVILSIIIMINLKKVGSNQL